MVVAILVALALAPGAVSIQDVQAATRLGLAHEVAIAKDPFAPSPDFSGLDGRPFMIEVPLQNGDVPGSVSELPFWSYDSAAGVLKLTASARLETMRGARSVLDSPHVIYISEQTEARPGYLGSTAFGASAAVDVIDTAAVAVGVFPSSRIADEFGDIDAALPGRSSIWTTDLRVSPEEARRLSAAARLRLTGLVVGNGAGRWVGCGAKKREPTLHNPLEYSRRFCAVSVRLDRVEFIDSSTGNALASWVGRQSRQ